MFIAGNPKYIIVPMSIVLLICQLIAVIIFLNGAMSKIANIFLAAGFFLNAAFLFLTLVTYFKSIFSKSNLFVIGFFTIVIINLCVIFFNDFTLFLSLASPSVFTWICILILLSSKDLKFKRVSKLGIYDVTKK